jgi:hypothetical protein
MEKMVYKFLDEYLGDEVDCIKKRPSEFNYYFFHSKEMYDTYNLCSKKNKTIIIVFTVSNLDGEIRMDISKPLNKLLSDLFSITDYTVERIIRVWFADKHNLDKVKDLIKFIPYATPSELTSFG